MNSQLLLYNLPPTEEIDLEEFEEFAFDRLKVLRSIEDFKVGTQKSLDRCEKNVASCTGQRNETNGDGN